MEIDGTIQQTDLPVAMLKLPRHTAGGKEMSIAGKYAKSTRNIDGAPVGEATYIVPSRTLPPQTSIVYGADKRPIGSVNSPDMIESQPMQNYGLHRPIFRGWRPKREETSYPDLGIELMSPERNYKIETAIPTEREMMVESVRNATVTYPAVPGSDGQIPDPYRYYGMAVEKSRNDPPPANGDDDFLNGMDGMGDTTTDAISSLAKSIADGIKAQYAAKGTPIVPQQPVQQQGGIPWGTIALVGGLGIVAMLVLPKLLK